MGAGDAESGRGGSKKPLTGRRDGQAPTWADSWAFARLHLGLEKTEFFALTPKLFADLCGAWRRERRRQGREQRALLALLRADVINFSQLRPKRRIEPRELLPAADLIDELPAAGVGQVSKMTAGRRRQVAEHLRCNLRAIAAASAPESRDDGRL